MLSAGFIVAFIVYFIKATTWTGMIFHPIISRLNFLPQKIRKPIFECPVCMTPWWGAVIYIIGHYTHLAEFHELTVQRVLFTIFTASGINTIFLIFNKLYDTTVRHNKEVSDQG